TVQPFRFGMLLMTAPTYFPACTHGSTRANDGRISPSSSARFRWPTPAHRLTTAAASGFAVFTNRMIARRLHYVQPASMHSAAGHHPNGGCRTSRRAGSWSDDETFM